MKWICLLVAASPLWPGAAAGQSAPAARSKQECSCNVDVLGIEFKASWAEREGEWSETVEVKRVTQDGSAARAGVRAGDTIVHVNDLHATSQLLWSVRRTLRPGETVRLRLRRAGRTHETLVQGRDARRPARTTP